MPRTTSQEFQTAVADSGKLTSKPSNDDLLMLYALFKQASQNPPIDNAPTPGMFDLKGKAKKAAWQKIVDQGITPEEAEQKYVELVGKLKETLGYDPTKESEAPSK